FMAVSPARPKSTSCPDGQHRSGLLREYLNPTESADTEGAEHPTNTAMRSFGDGGSPAGRRASGARRGQFRYAFGMGDGSAPAGRLGQKVTILVVVVPDRRERLVDIGARSPI